MPRVGRRLGITFLIAIVAVAGLFAFAPREPLDVVPAFDAARLPEDLDSYLRDREAVVGGITPGTEKRILWAGAAAARTEWAVVYLHGFSATSEEIRPVPDDVAAGLGANLYFTRLAGHGLAGGRLAGPSVNDWMIDVAEALAIGKRIGRRVLVMGTSTGGTLAAEAALQPALARQMDGIVFVSPNFGIRSLATAVLTWPFARHWVPYLAGREQCFKTMSESHARFWTTCYPTEAPVPMVALAGHAAAADYSGVTVPALFLFAEADQIASPAATRTLAEGWGGPVSVLPQVVGAGDDPHSHVIAGDIRSPSMTAPVTQAILDWAGGL